MFVSDVTLESTETLCSRSEHDEEAAHRPHTHVTVFLYDFSIAFGINDRVKILNN